MAEKGRIKGSMGMDLDEDDEEDEVIREGINPD